MSLIPSEVRSGRKVYGRYQAQPHLRKESDLGNRYRICSNLVGWITPKGDSPQFTGVGSGVLVRLQTRVNGEWIDYKHNAVVSMEDLYPNFSSFQELCQFRRERTEEMYGRG